MFAWRRKGLVLLGLLVGLALGYLYFLRQVPVYQSAAQVLIVEDRPQLPIEGIDVRPSTENLHAELMRSHVVIDKAVHDGQLEQLASLRGGSSIAAVMRGLDVIGGGSDQGAIIKLTYESTHVEDCPKVLAAIINAYEAFLADLYQDVSKETIDLIDKAKNELQNQIATKEAEYRKLRDSSPLLVTGETTQNFHEGRQQQIETVRSDAMLENSKLQANIAAIEAALARGSSREALNLMVGHIEELQTVASQNPANPTRSRNEQLFPLLVEEQLLLERLGPEHPQVIAMRKRIELTKQYLAKLHADLPAAPEAPPPPQDYYKIYLESLHEKIKMNEALIAQMTELYESEREAARSLSMYQVQEETYRSEIDRLTTLFNAVVNRLNEISLVKDRGTTSIRIIHPPSFGYQIEPDLQSTMIISGVLALLGGLALAFVVDAADRRFRSPEEIRADLGVPVVGHIPVITAKSKTEVSDAVSPFRPEIRVVHAPRGRVAEAYRAVRTALYFSTRGGGHQVIQITSPNPGDGKTTLSSNLAVSIANSGKRVLLIDADFRRPRVHRLLGASNETGFSQVIQGTTELADAIQETPIPNFSLLTCGARPDNPSELLTSRRFEELVEVLRERYELVLIDTPPVLPVTDPLNVAPRVDAVLVVLRLNKAARNAGRRALDALEEVGAKVLGVVVNGVEGGRGYGGAYGQYGYRYSYESYGRYGGDYSDKVYYSSEDEAGERPAPAGSHRNGNGKHSGDYDAHR